MPTYTDTDRLDWLERNPRLSELHVNGKVEHSYLYAVAGAPGVKLREILDACMVADKVQPR